VFKAKETADCMLQSWCKVAGSSKEYWIFD